MERIFSLDNPVWKFIGNIADMFFLSVLWYLCLIPVFTAGCATSAMYYVTLKMTRDLEGKTISQFIKSFKLNFKQTTTLWIPSVILLTILFIDIKMAVLSTSAVAVFIVVIFFICLLLITILLSMLFPLIARCDDSTVNQLKNCVKICIRNPLASLSVALINISLILLGLFVFWPILLIAPGFSAYLNSYVINRIFDKYSMSLE
ncbi:MAG: YesL family protein [Eubacterium sp.]|nr:YesL family protein [Eubacterium sp.]